jgi:hypothetical protein
MKAKNLAEQLPGPYRNGPEKKNARTCFSLDAADQQSPYVDCYNRL